MAKIETYVLATSPLSFSDMLIGTEIDGPIPNATKNFSLQELYGLFATMPITGNLQQVLDTGNSAIQDIVLTGDIASTTITPQYIVDGLASTGAVGEVLTRAVSGMSWAPPTIQNLQSVLNSGSTATSNMSLVGDFTSTKIIPGNIQDYLGNTGSTGQVLYKSVSGLLWANLPAATIPTLQQVLDAGFSATANIILTGTINATNIKPASITDELNATGTVGQALTRSSTGIRWDSLNFVNTVTATSPITSTGGYNPVISSLMNTNKLIGRSTAGVGVMEEISIGAGLSLVGGTLTSTASGGGIKSGIASGTDTYTVTISGVTSYADGDAYLIRFTNGNTTGATLNINSLGAKTLYRNNDGVLIGGDIEDGSEMLCVYNTTLNGFQVIGTSPNSLIAYVTNDDSVTITKGQPVYAFSGTGDRMTVKRAYNTSDATSAQTVGLVLSSSIAPNQKGFIMMQGLLDGLNILPTATWNDGDPVYLGATAGTITNVKPYAPNHLVYLGIVTTASNGSAGRLYVRVQNGFEMNELHDVQSNGAVNKDILYRDTTVTPNLWKPASVTTILGYTPVPTTRTLTINGTTYDLSADRSWTVTAATKSINNVSTNTTAGSASSTDYIYLVSGVTTITLPTAVGNTNLYTIKRVGTGTVSVDTTLSQTIDGSTSPITIDVRYVSITLISDGANWNII